jgi:hypothetical protein
VATEFEHKLVVTGDQWREAVVRRSSLSQAYLATQPGLTIRVRVVDDERAYVTIKGRQAGIGRPEYEYEIPVADATELLGLAQEGYPISKVRYDLGEPWPGWVVDESPSSRCPTRRPRGRSRSGPVTTSPPTTGTPMRSSTPTRTHAGSAERPGWSAQPSGSSESSGV